MATRRSIPVGGGPPPVRISYAEAERRNREGRRELRRRFGCNMPLNSAERMALRLRKWSGKA